MAIEYTVLNEDTGEEITFEWEDEINEPTDADLEEVFAQATTFAPEPVKPEPITREPFAVTPATQDIPVGVAAPQPVGPIPFEQAKAEDIGVELFKDDVTAATFEPEGAGIQAARTAIEGTKQVARAPVELVRTTAESTIKLDTDRAMQLEQEAQELLDKPDMTEFDRITAKRKQQDAKIARGKVEKATGIKKQTDKVLKQEWLQPVDVERPSGVAGYVQDIIRTAPQLAAQVGFTAMTGPVGGGLFMGTQIAGSKAEELKKKGISPERALVASLSSAALQAPIEQLPMLKLFSKWTPKGSVVKTIKEVATQAGSEFFTEAFQKYPDAAADIWAETEGETNEIRLGKFLNNFWDITKAALYEGSIGAVLGGAAGVGKVGAAEVAARPAEIAPEVPVVPEPTPVSDEPVLDIVEPPTPVETEVKVEDIKPKEAQPFVEKETPEGLQTGASETIQVISQDTQIPIETSEKVVKDIEIEKRKKKADVTLQDVENRFREEVPGLTDEQYQAAANIAGRHVVSNLPSQPHYNSRVQELASTPEEGMVDIGYSIDLNNFKRVNDIIGHDYGDDIMVQSQNAMRDVAEENGWFHAHKGGDEGAGIIRVPESDVPRVLEVLNDIKNTVNQIDIEAPKGRVPLGVSMGVSTDADATKIFEKADQALKDGKNVVGKNSIFFDNELKNKYNIEDVKGEDLSNAYEDAGLFDVRVEEDRRAKERIPDEKQPTDIFPEPKVTKRKPPEAVSKEQKRPKARVAKPGEPPTVEQIESPTGDAQVGENVLQGEKPTTKVRLKESAKKATESFKQKYENVTPRAIDAEDINNLAVVGASIMQDTGAKINPWKNQMRTTFGEDIDASLNDIWEASKEINKTLGEGGFVKIPFVEKRPPGERADDNTDNVARSIPDETKAEVFERKVIDQFGRLKKIQKEFGVTDEKQDAYTKQELFSGRVESRLTEFENTQLVPLLKKIQRSKIPLEKIEDYLYAKHAPERNARIQEINPEFAKKDIPGSGMSNEEAQAIIDKAKAEGIDKKLEEIAQLVYDINNKSADILVESGLLDQETRDAFKVYKNYVPLRGIDEVETKPGIGRGFDVRGAETKRALGRKSKARNILAHMVEQMNKAIVRSEKNKVNQAFLEFIKANPDNTMWEIGKPIKRQVFNKSKGEVETKTLTQFSKADLKKAGVEDVLTVKDGGKEIEIFIKDKPLANAMLNLGQNKSGKFIQTMASFSRYISMVNTSLSPGFIPTNFVRDVQAALINATGQEGMSAKESAKFAKDITKNVIPAMGGILEATRGEGKGKMAQWYNEFRSEGGQIGFFGLKDVNKIQDRLVRDISRLKPGVSPVKMMRSFGQLVMDVNGAVENATRLSTYIAMRQRGVSKEKSASAAKNITVNFNKKGEIGGTLNALYVFSNAGIQGSVRMLQAMKSKRVQALAGSIITGSVALAQLNRHIAGEDDDGENYYDKIPKWIKGANIIIMNPVKKGEFFKIPVPYGYNIFHATGQAIDMGLHNAKDVPEAASMVASAMGNAFNPLGGDVNLTSLHSLTRAAAPTIAEPAVDLLANKNFFEAPIYKEQKFGPKTARAVQALKSDSKIAKDIAEKINEYTGGGRFKSGVLDIPPGAYDFVFEYLTGSSGKFINQAVDLAANAYTKDKTPIRRVPIVRRFYGEVEDYGDVEKFYNTIEGVRSKRNEFEWLAKTNPSKAKEFANKNKKELLLSVKRSFEDPTTGRKRSVSSVGKAEKDIKDLRESVLSFEQKLEKARVDKNRSQEKFYKGKIEETKGKIENKIDFYNKMFKERLK